VNVTDATELKIAMLIPVYNGGIIWQEALQSLSEQRTSFFRKIIIDSGSKDDSVNKAVANGFEVINITANEFNHGLARQILVNNAPDADVYVFLTQDCILADAESIGNLVNAFQNPAIGLAYGRQLPRIGARVLESHSRLFNYPDKSVIKEYQDRDKLGIKTASCSNSFAAYRKHALNQVGGFPLNSIFGEDVIVGGRMLIKGWKIAYVSNARSYHSHDYTVIEEFKRYFDIGVFHSTNYWLIEEFGKASGEGLKYVKSELRYVLNNQPLLLPKMMLSTVAKYAGYKIGLKHKLLSTRLKKAFSMHKKYWNDTQASNK
jgi:rhamnosyltransferase